MAVMSVVHVASKFMHLCYHTKRAIAIHLEGIFPMYLEGTKAVSSVS